MLRLTVMLALIPLAFGPAQAKPDAPVVAEKDGYKFEYMSRLESDQHIRIDGVYLDLGEEFTFTVDPKGRVSGHVGNRPVRFSIARRKRDALAAALAQKQGIDLAESRLTR